MQKLKTLFIFLFLLVGTALQSQAQEIIRGIVADSATFAPLPYVTIQVKSQSRGTTTDSKGNFSLIATQRDTLVISFVGYQTLELPLLGWEPSMIMLAEKYTMLKSVTVRDNRLDNMYEGMFDEQNAALRKQNKNIKFYYSKEKKEKIKVGRLENENLRVKTYVDLIINDPKPKADMMRKYKLTEKEYYDILTQFNAKNYQVMYYLTAGELLTIYYSFFEKNAPPR